jgi:predicted alpha-1,6-mannanase (GH76 family)
MRSSLAALLLLASAPLVLSQTPAASSAPAPAAMQAAPLQAAPAPFPKTTYREEAAQGIARLQSYYNQQTGLYMPHTGWWNSANIITMLADDSLATHSRQFVPVFRNTLLRAQIRQTPDASIANDKPGFPGFLNKYYDDEGWWALAWISVYDVTHDKRYLATAESIFDDMAAGWDDTCSGGIWWSKDRTYKNAIANELFLSVASHLATRERGKSRRAKYLQWARREWQWFQSSGMINDQHLVNDGLNLRTCRNNGRKTWSYNQGVILGGLAELSRALDREHTPDPAPLTIARQIAEAAFTHLTDADGILTDRCEPRCSGDSVQFKGIFARNLVELDRAAPHPRYLLFLDVNADSIWTRSQAPDHSFGQAWQGPYTAADASKNQAGIQGSALDALVAAAQLQARARN